MDNSRYGDELEQKTYLWLFKRNFLKSFGQVKDICFRWKQQKFQKSF